MFIRFACRRCRTALEISVKMAGHPVHCPTCRNELIVPSSSEPLAALPQPTSVVQETPQPAPVTTVVTPPVAQPSPRWLDRHRLAAVLAATVLLGAAFAWPILFRSWPTSTTAPKLPTMTVAPRPEHSWPVTELAVALAEHEDMLRTGSAVTPMKPAKSFATGRLQMHLNDAPAHASFKAVSLHDQPAASPVVERELVRELHDIPEVTLDRRTFGVVVEAYKASQQEARRAGYTTYDPTHLVQVYPGIRTMPLRYGSSCKLDQMAASRLDRLSRRLRIALATYAPVGPDHHRTSPELLRSHLLNELRGEDKQWLRAGAIPALMQQLMAEETPFRALLVELLAQIKDRQASIALAKRAVFDLSPAVRDMAITALRERPLDDYRWVFLRALRYPWAPAAHHAADALISLHDYQAIPLLVGLLNQPDPRAPLRVGKKKYAVRELVRTNHLANCLMCHPPSVTYRDPVPGVVPAVTWNFLADPKQVPQLVSTINSITGQLTSTGSTEQTGCHNYAATSSTSAVTIRNQRQAVTLTSTVTTVRNAAGQLVRVTLPVLQVARQGAPTPSPLQQQQPRQPVPVSLPLFVRGDITWLRQDFSVPQMVPQPDNSGPLPMRFDYMVRTRFVSREEAQLLSTDYGKPNYEQRTAVLRTLRELTGLDAGDATSAWQRALPHAASEAKAQELGDAVLKAKPSKRHALLVELRDGKGLAYSETLTRMIHKLRGADRTDARELLAHRLTRMTAGTLQAKLHEDDAEVRRAAARACGLKQAVEHVPDLIELLDDPDPAVVRAAHHALTTLSGCDYGPDNTSTPEDHMQAVAAWKGWSEKIGRN